MVTMFGTYLQGTIVVVIDWRVGQMSRQVGVRMTLMMWLIPHYVSRSMMVSIASHSLTTL